MVSVMASGSAGRGGGILHPGRRSTSFIDASGFVSNWVSEIIMGRPYDAAFSLTKRVSLGRW